MNTVSGFLDILCSVNSVYDTGLLVIFSFFKNQSW